MCEHRELYEMRFQMECIVPILERIATALERMVPEGSEREQISLRFWTEFMDIMPDRCFALADKWIAERDKQRAQQAEQGRAE